ncbi:hypothetical protein SADUNF_Sadunf08G0089800 [Salix dunnii]|uniref:Uncharacterized protein n=1 Tax=Salix dunnii TaxID=1413687 RepID=A0A835JW07_9ROSI|nr:hypothetical protein SADUNF_Sadunf08G0089800 [Salix dunnii]
MDADGSLTTARDRCSSKFSWPQTYRRSASCLLSNMDANGNVMLNLMSWSGHGTPVNKMWLQYMIADVTPEFKKAMFSLNRNKAHGPDGFSADLFKKSWNIVGEDAVAASACIYGRRIGDNILISKEVVKGYHRKNMPPSCTLEMDLMKAFDSIKVQSFEERVFFDEADAYVAHSMLAVIGFKIGTLPFEMYLDLLMKAGSLRVARVTPLGIGKGFSSLESSLRIKFTTSWEMEKLLNCGGIVGIHMGGKKSLSTSSAPAVVFHRERTSNFIATSSAKETTLCPREPKWRRAMEILPRISSSNQ